MATTGQADGTVALGALQPLERRFSLPRPRLALGPLPGQLALAFMIAASFTVVMFSSARESTLVPGSAIAFPHWMSGPLHGLFGGLTNHAKTLDLGFTIVMLAMLVAYGIVLASVRTLSMRTLWICLVVLLVIMLMGPPLQLTDVFNYLGYARLGGLHHLNPYTHVIGAISYDPVSRLASWHNLTSPYGELFTALTYPLSYLPLAVAYWILKVVTVVAALAFVWVVTFCARQMGRDPRFALAFVALNPVFVIYAVGGFHNDFLLLLPSMAAVAFVLTRRDRAAGAVLMLAVGVKFTAIVLLPFLLVATRADRRWLRVLTGAVLAAIPLVAGSIALFGSSLPNLSDQSTLLTDFSIPQVVGLVIGIGGGTPGPVGDRQGPGGTDRGLHGVAGARLALGCRVGDPGADREPGLADAVVRDLAAAVGGARHQHPAAPGGDRADAVPGPDVCARGVAVHEQAQHQPAQRVGGPGVADAPAQAGAGAVAASGPATASTRS